jgi:hypothetical protein
MMRGEDSIAASMTSRRAGDVCRSISPTAGHDRAAIRPLEDERRLLVTNAKTAMHGVLGRAMLF